jgi:hypothetical protein
MRLIDVVSDIRRSKLVMSPYFQRKLVWRLTHKVDFIKTILLGYPFPEIFIAEGYLDIESMTSKDFLVDGQQRLNSIIEFIDGKFDVDGKIFEQLDPQKKEEFLKYEIAIIDLDLNHDDPTVIEVFKRLNRTFYSLTYIEKLSTEYAACEMMLLAKLISGELKTNEDKINEENWDPDIENFESLEFDPSIPVDFIDWSKTVNVKKTNELITKTSVFSSYAISRQVHLMFSLNVLGTIKEGIFNRNVGREMLERYKDKFDSKDEILQNLELISEKILKLKLKKDSYWYNKANLFSLIIGFYNNRDKIINLPEAKIKDTLVSFENTVPDEFRLAAKEGINNRKEREIRDRYVKMLIDSIEVP